MEREKKQKLILMTLAIITALVISLALPGKMLAKGPGKPPVNDDFSHAIVVTSLPYSNTEDTSRATATGDPGTNCSYGGQPTATVWYSYTPADETWVSARTDGSSYNTTLAVYTLTDGFFNEVNCGNTGLLFDASGGQTYYIMIGESQTYPYPAPGANGGTLVFTMAQEAIPQPVAGFYFYPYDPNIYDTVYFYDYSYDPAQKGITSWAWDFGDGATATDPYTFHQYAADGDYTVKLTVTTSDGRTAETSQVVAVRTHDVGITRFSLPENARPGQTRPVYVYATSSRYPERVKIDLYKSSQAGYWEWVGSLINEVPVSAPNQAVRFSFSYTFTLEDAKVGKVTFRAVANALDSFEFNLRDAFPADNEVISLPVKVR